MSEKLDSFIVKISSTPISAATLKLIMDDFDKLPAETKEAIASRQLFSFFSTGIRTDEHKSQRNMARAFFLIRNIIDKNTLVNQVVLRTFKDNTPDGKQASSKYFDDIQKEYLEQSPVLNEQKKIAKAQAEILKEKSEQKIQTDAFKASLEKRLQGAITYNKVRDEQETAVLVNMFDKFKGQAETHYLKVKTDYIYNHANTLDACKQAYEQYNLAVGDASDAIAAKKALVVLCFNTLAGVTPPPFNLIPTAFALAFDNLTKVDRLETRINRGTISNSPSLISKTTEKITGLLDDYGTLGPTLEQVKACDLVGSLITYSTNMMQSSQEVIDKKLTLFFSAKKYQALIDENRESQMDVSSIRMRMSGAGHTYGLAARVQSYGENILKAITIETPLKKEKVVILDAGGINNLARLIEFQLLCAYIINVYAKNDSFSANVEQAILLRFDGDNNDQFSILTQSSDNSQEKAAKFHRIKWEGNINHKKSLNHFCKWYVKNINPFHVITGETTIEETRVKYKTFIDNFNKTLAISGVRKKGFLAIHTTWDWDLIERNAPI
ncbi:MAG: hypothetical protein RIQ94_2296 [Pseudomonadota bacterium]|jgi:hypothetical protein